MGNAEHAANINKLQAQAHESVPANRSPEDGFTRRYYGRDIRTGQNTWYDSAETRARYAIAPYWYVDVKEGA